MPYWIEANDNLVRVSTFCVSVVDHCKFAKGTWVECLHVFGHTPLRS
jgi:hypothetical protein